ncbi:hypothetical protein HDR59_05185 [bacterium]|nr:hypothetical protein [bacterium]
MTNLKSELKKWIDNTYSPKYLMTIQLPDNLKSENLEHSITHLKNIMKDFERLLLHRHWNKKHIPFIAFAEKGVSEDWHFHLLFNGGNFTYLELETAIQNIISKQRLPKYCLQIDEIKNDIAKVEYYTIKEIKITNYKHFDSDRMILSHDLFNIDVKK